MERKINKIGKKVDTFKDTMIEKISVILSGRGEPAGTAGNT